MSPYRDMTAHPLGPRWGVTTWKKLFVRLIRWWKPVRCREHGMLQSGAKVSAFHGEARLHLDWVWGCPTCELRRLHQEVERIRNLDPQQVHPWMLGISATKVQKLLEAHKKLRTTSGGPS